MCTLQAAPPSCVVPPKPGGGGAGAPRAGGGAFPGMMRNMGAAVGNMGFPAMGSNGNAGPPPPKACAAGEEQGPFDSD